MSDIEVQCPVDKAILYRAADVRTAGGQPATLDGPVRGTLESGLLDAVVESPGGDPSAVLFVPPAVASNPGDAPHVYQVSADGDPRQGVEAIITDRLLVTVTPLNAATLGGIVSLVDRPAPPPGP